MKNRMLMMLVTLEMMLGRVSLEVMLVSLEVTLEMLMTLASFRRCDDKFIGT